MLNWFFPKPSENRLRKAVRDIVILVVIIFAFRAFSYQHFLIPSGSMIPSLRMGDFVIVHKGTFGYSRYSLPLHVNLIKDRIFYNRKPQRGEVIVFTNPKDTKMDFIKRCVGIPGDKIQLRAGKLYINGEACEYEQIEDHIMYDHEGNERRVHRFIETFPDGFKHEMQLIQDSDSEVRFNHPRNNTEEFTIPEGHYFALGDNRHNSRDSRDPDPGFIPEQFLLGSASHIFFSVDFGFYGNPMNPFTWYKVRIKPKWERFGKKIV